MTEKTTTKLTEQQLKIIKTVRKYLQTRLSIHLFDQKSSEHKDTYCLSYPVNDNLYGIFKHIVKSCTVDVTFYDFLTDINKTDTIRISINLSYKHHGGGSNGHSTNFSFNYYTNSDSLIEVEN